MDLSVIIPCHDEAATLPAQLDALASQRWDGSWEVLVVDNGSQDGTADVAAAHAGLAGRLRVVAAPDGVGVSFARRCGVDASTADAIAFCDGDDLVADGWVAAMGDALREHQLVTGEIGVDRLNDAALATSRGQRRMGVPPTYGPVVFLRGNNGGMWRTVWDRLGGFDEGFHGLEDIELSLRAAAHGMFVHFEPGALVHYRYRARWRGLWKQGLFYGASYPMLRRRCRDLGLAAPPRSSAWRSWAWLVVFAPQLARSSVRRRWVWTLACRIGAARGGIQTRLRRG